MSEGERDEKPGVLDTRCLKELRLFFFFFFFFFSLSVQRTVRPNDITVPALGRCSLRSGDLTTQLSPKWVCLLQPG